MKLKLTIHPSKISLIKHGHPWVFPKAIVTTAIHCKVGELVALIDTNDELIGLGIYNPHSLYRVRVLVTSIDPLTTLTSLKDIIDYRLSQAATLRKRLGLPTISTNAFRLFNSEADGLSGLTIDRFDTIAVISSSAYWVESHRQLILSCLEAHYPELTFLWFSQTKALSQDGWKETNLDTFTHQTIVKEHDVQFHIDFSTSQKTGLYLDQRENHQRMASYAKDARILDLYTYTGGFALHAAKAGAAYVCAVDSSASAIARAKENAALNNLEQIEFIKADARNYLSKAGNYDIVLLDPPKLAPSQRSQGQAKNYYRFLHKEVFKSMHSGSLLMTCNCSSALNTKAFVELVYLQALAVGKTFKVLGIYGPAACHPTLPIFPEGQYLTALLGVVV